MPGSNEMADEIADEMRALARALARRARYAGYVAVGLGVLGLQRARAAQHDLGQHDLLAQDRLDEGVARLRAGVEAGSHRVGAWLDDTVELVSSQLAPLGEQLPEPARELALKARAALGELGAQLRHFPASGA